MLRGEPCAWFAKERKYWEMPFSEIVDDLPTRAIKMASRADARIRLTNNGRIDFWSMDRQQTGRGYSYKRVVIDGFDPELWEPLIRPCLVDLSGEALILR